MIDWPTLAYLAAVVVAYLWGRSSRGRTSYKKGFSAGVNFVADVLIDMGHNDIIVNISKKLDEKIANEKDEEE